MSTKYEVNFGGSTVDLDPVPDPYLGCTFWPEFKVHTGSGSGPIYVIPKLILVVVVGSTVDPDLFQIIFGM